VTTTPTEVTCTVPIAGLTGAELCYFADGDFVGINGSGEVTSIWAPHTTTLPPSAITTGCGTTISNFVPYSLTPVP
jgi:hypothetical protein